MPFQTLLTWTLALVSFLPRSAQLHAVTVESLTCIPAAGYVWKETYGAAVVPQSGSLQKVTLDYVEGGVDFCAPTPTTCSSGIFGFGQNGIGITWPGNSLGVYITRSDHKIVMYPIAGQTAGFRALPTAPGFYAMDPYLGSSKSITFNGPAQPVRQGEILKFYFGEVLKSINYADNTGTTCVRVKLTYVTAPQAPVPAKSLTCIPSTGYRKSVYGAAHIPTGGQLQKVTLDYVSGGAQFCYPTPWVCSPGTFGWGINGLGTAYPGFSLGVYVTRSDAKTVMFPIAGATVGYRALPAAPGFYAMDPFKGDGKRITFDGPTHSIRSGEIIKFFFGEVLQQVAWTDNKGTTCASVSVTYAGPPPTITPPPPTPKPTVTLPTGSCRGFGAVCTCLGDVMCKTFDGYQYKFERANRHVLMKAANYNFEVSVLLSSTSTLSSIVSSVRVKTLAIEIEMHVGSTTALYRRPPSLSWLPMVNGQRMSSGPAGASFVVQHDSLVGDLLLSATFPGIRLHNDIHVRLTDGHAVYVYLTDCYMNRGFTGMCGSFDGSQATDAVMVANIPVKDRNNKLVNVGALSQTVADSESAGIGLLVACTGVAIVLGVCLWKLSDIWKGKDWAPINAH